MRRASGRFTALTSLALVVAALLAGCGGDQRSDDQETDSDDEAPGELIPVTVGTLPLADQAPFFYGVEQGFFADEGLDITIETSGAGGAELVPSVLSGDFQFAFSNYLSLMQARENDAPVQIVSSWVNGAEGEDQGTLGLLVAPDSGIDSVEDLAGKTFGVNTLDNIATVAIRAVLDEHGVDDSEIELTEVGFPEMNGAIEAGTIDVALQTEPFVTLGKEAGLVSLLDPMYEMAPSLPLVGVFAAESWLEANPEVADAFARGLQRSLAAASDADAMRETIAAETETPPDIVEVLPLANWQPEIDRDALALQGELATGYGILSEEPDLEQLIWTAG